MELDISKMYMLIMNWVYEKPLRTKSGQNIDHITQRMRLLWESIVENGKQNQNLRNINTQGQVQMRAS